MKALFTFLILFAFVQCGFLFAHGPIHELIAQISDEIKAQPDNASLYLKRGEYHRIDENFDAAYSDFQRALDLDSSLSLEVDFQMASLFSEHGYALSGMKFIDSFLRQRPSYPKALLVRAGLQLQLGQDSLALESFTQALSYSKEPRPHHYIDIARACLRADSTNFDGALKWLKEGEQSLGFNIVLRSYAIEIDCKRQAWDEALAKVNDIISRLPRHEKWLLEKSRIFEMAGRHSEASAAYQATIDAIERLPRRNRSTRMVMEWEAEALAALQRLEQP